MPHPKLLRLAQNAVQRALDKLPPEIRAAANECMVSYEDSGDSMSDDETLAEDLLGLLEGCNRLDPPPISPDDMPRIRLFLDNLWDCSDHDERTFRKEVRITFLHELGHYLGWDEEQIAAIGLG